MKTILVLTDLSEKATHLAEYALNIATKVGSDILLFNSFVIPEQSTSKFKWRLVEYFDVQDNIKRKLKMLADHLEEKSQNSDFRPMLKFRCRESEGDLGTDIKNVLESDSIWMILMGSKDDKCISNLADGTIGDSILKSTNCPVLFVPRNAPIKDISRMAIATNIKTSELAPISFFRELKESFNPDIIIADEVTPEEFLDRRKEFVKVSRYVVSDTASSVSFYEDAQTANLDKATRKNEVDLLGIIYHKDHSLHDEFHYHISNPLESEQLPLLISYTA